MIGTWINVGAILLGALLGLATKFDVSPHRQQFIKVVLGVATVWFGFKLLWNGLAGSGGAKSFAYQFIIVLVAMVVGHLIGKVCGIQSMFNRLGQAAKKKLENAVAKGPNGRNDGFLAAAILFTATPLGIVGGLEDGMSRYWAPLAIKAVMDALAALSFARAFGWTALLSAIPVAALLMALTVVGARVEPWLAEQHLIGVTHASAGLIMTYVALVIFEVKKVEIANYLPALIAAPALMKLAQMVFGR